MNILEQEGLKEFFRVFFCIIYSLNFFQKFQMLKKLRMFWEEYVSL